ncbi:hypothetical protein SBV1_130121 [Verrucomicrobia bacterium]|nr:hypothetical protein SBV1_130121 [Verrucomicrobiota bacterium]
MPISRWTDLLEMRQMIDETTVRLSEETRRFPAPSSLTRASPGSRGKHVRRSLGVERCREPE